MNNVKHLGGRVVADGTVKLRIRCVAYPESSPHYADAVVVSATSLTLSVDGVADSTVGSSGVLAFATYTTLGTLVDAINLSDNWEAEIVAGLRSDAVNGSELLARSTSTFRMFQEVSLFADSSDNGVGKVQFLLEPNKPFDRVHGLDSQQTYHQARVGVRQVRGLINTSDSGAWDLNVYELKPDKSAVFKTLAVFVGADNTEKDSGQTDEIMFHADWGNSILVEAVDASWADSGAYLDVQGVREQA